jgi:hypothetical protein
MNFDNPNNSTFTGILVFKGVQSAQRNKIFLQIWYMSNIRQSSHNPVMHLHSDCTNTNNLIDDVISHQD